MNTKEDQFLRKEPTGKKWESLVGNGLIDPHLPRVVITSDFSLKTGHDYIP